MDQTTHAWIAVRAVALHDAVVNTAMIWLDT